MFPTLGDLLGFPLPVPTHGVFVALGILAAGIVFVVEAILRGHNAERLDWVVRGTLGGGDDADGHVVAACTARNAA
jgi:hypothetical protein